MFKHDAARKEMFARFGANVTRAVDDRGDRRAFSRLTLDRQDVVMHIGQSSQFAGQTVR